MNIYTHTYLYKHAYIYGVEVLVWAGELQVSSFCEDRFTEGLLPEQAEFARSSKDLMFWVGRRAKPRQMSSNAHHCLTVQQPESPGKPMSLGVIHQYPLVCYSCKGGMFKRMLSIIANQIMKDEFGPQVIN